MLLADAKGHSRHAELKKVSVRKVKYIFELSGQSIQQLQYFLTKFGFWTQFVLTI